MSTGPFLLADTLSRGADGRPASCYAESPGSGKGPGIKTRAAKAALGAVGGLWVSSSQLLRRAAPVLFVLIWSTGFITGRAAKPHADLLLFLLVRLGITAALFAATALVAFQRGGVALPPLRKVPNHLLAGVLMQGVYLGFAYWAMSHGLAAGVMSLIGALQPLFTALIGTLFLREHLSRRAWAGLGVGFAGVALVLLPKVGGDGGLTPLTVLAALGSVAGMTAGTLWQKSLGAADLRVASALQNLGGTVMIAVLIALQTGLEGRAVFWDGAPALWAALGWSVVMPSLVAVTLLVWMVRQGEATRATSLILLVPPLAAVQGFLLFGETLTAVQLGGFALALAGVTLTRRALTPPPPTGAKAGA